MNKIELQKLKHFKNVVESIGNIFNVIETFDKNKTFEKELLKLDKLLIDSNIIVNDILNKLNKETK